MININFDNIKKQLNQALKDKGFDELNRFILIIIIICLFIDIFFKNLFFGILLIILLIIFLLRLFSKNTYKRVRQNRIFLEIFTRIKEPFRNIKKKLYRDKNHLYKKCPKCGLILKLPLPKKIGIKHSTCPDCGHRFGFLTLRRRRR